MILLTVTDQSYLSRWHQFSARRTELVSECSLTYDYLVHDPDANTVVAEDCGSSRRAQPLAPDDRKAMIIDAVTPLILEQGASVTSKQLAEAAGLAEGTIFRAFGDKQSLLTAVFERYLDPEPMRKELRSIDPAEPLEIKIRLIIEILRNRFGSIFRVRAALEQHSQPHLVSQREHLNQIIAELLEPDLDRLLWSRAAVSHLVRMLALSSAIPRLNEGFELSSDELASMVLYGIVGAPPEPPSQQPNNHHNFTPSTRKEHHAA